MAVQHLKTAEFDAVVEAAPLAMVDFWADWCGPCRMLSPIIEEIAGEHPEIKVGKINVDEEPDLAQAYQIMSIPALLVIKNGKIVASSVGVQPKGTILKMIQ